MMPRSLLVRRVEILEENVDSLSHLPARVRMVETQLFDLRDDVTSFRGEFASFRAETRGELTEIRSDITEIRGDITAIRGDIIGIRGDITEIRGDIIGIRGDITEIRGDITGIRGEFAVVRDEIRAGDEETRRQMRILHEEVISRIALLQEGASNGKARRSRSREKSRPR
jgi:chromosome segregation ATPase